MRIDTFRAGFVALLLSAAASAHAQFKNPMEQYALIAESRLETAEIRFKCREVVGRELESFLRAQPAAGQLAAGNATFFCQPYVRATGSDEGLQSEASIVFVTRQGAVLPFVFKP
jgi:hypothetical protein